MYSQSMIYSCEKFADFWKHEIDNFIGPSFMPPIRYSLLTSFFVTEGLVPCQAFWIWFQSAKPKQFVSQIYVFMVSCGDGKYVIAYHSVDHPGCLPEKDLARAVLHPSGWVIEQHRSKPKHSIVSYIVHAEVKGNIPNSVSRSLVKKSCMEAISRMNM